jgi:hypothetical protein
VDFESGASGIVLVLGLAGSIEGSLLADEGIPLDNLEVDVEPVAEDAEELPWESRRATVAQDGTFGCGPLPAGVYDVSLIAGWSETLLEVKGVEVGVGHVTRPSELDRVDLRGVLHAFRLTLAGAAEDGVLRGWVRSGKAGGGERPSQQWFQGGEAVVISRHDTIDVDVDVDGYRTARLRDVTGDCRVELQRGLRVHVVLTGDGEPLAEPYGLSVELCPADGAEGGSISWNAPRFDERREVLLDAKITGRVKVVWVLEKAVAGASTATRADAEPEQILMLDEHLALQRVEVRLTSEEARRLRARLDR